MANDEKSLRLAEPPNHIIIENREKLSVSGVEDVLSFDEKRVEAYTTKGLLIITGLDLHIDSLSIDKGELLLTGQIDSLTYAEDYTQKQGFWSSLFK